MKCAGFGAALLLCSLSASNAVAADDQVFVHVEAPAGTEVRWLAPHSEESVVACVAPCDRYLTTDGEYRFYRPGKSASKAIQLRPSSSGGPIDVTVRASRVGVGVGIPLFILGAITTAGGAKLTIASHDAPQSIASGIGKILGPFFIIAGSFEMITGGILAFLDTGTVVKQGPAEGQVAPMQQPSNTSFLRTPTWSARAVETRALPMLPLSFSTTF